MGLMVVNTGELPEPNEQDPCHHDKTQAFAKINGRFCENLPKFNADTNGAGDMVETIAHLIAKWASAHPTKLNENAITALEDLLKPGRFCNNFKKLKTEKLEIHENLKKLTWAQLLGAKSLVSLEKKNKGCTTDIKRSKLKPTAFKATLCGAEILGFVSGMRSTAHLQENRTQAAPSCKKPIQRLYDGLDVGQTMCVRQNTDPLLVARIFTKNFKLIRGQPSFWAFSDLFDAGALGAVGYETIYRGFLCRNEAELRARQK